MVDNIELMVHRFLIGISCISYTVYDISYMTSSSVTRSPGKYRMEWDKANTQQGALFQIKSFYEFFVYDC